MKHKFKFAALAMILFAMAIAQAEDAPRPTLAECSTILSRPVDWGHTPYVLIATLGMTAAQCIAYPSVKERAMEYVAAATSEQATRMASYLDRHGYYDDFLDEEKRRATQLQAVPKSQ